MLQCGKIHCEQEGFGPCLFCKAEVSKPTDVLTKRQREEVGLVQAIHRRNKLLDFDRQFAQRTTVIDDQIADLVFGGSEKNHWLNEEEKADAKRKEKRIAEIMEKQENRSSRILKYKFDFAGRRVVEDDTDEINEQEEMKSLINDIRVSQSGTRKNNNTKKTEEIDYDYTKQPVKTVIAPNLIHPSIANSHQLKYQDTTTSASSTSKSGAKKQNQQSDQAATASAENNNNNNDKQKKGQQKHQRSMIIQDEVYETEDHSQDMGYCMSMHQPWASLLVHGIKKHEGRSWTHSHRGRLWIASTVQEAPEPLIREWEDFYKSEPLNRTRENGYQHPKHYPLGVILGCVDVEDVVSQEEYSERFPDANEHESESDYVFICSNPRRLVVPLPISGRPKIYKLSREDLIRCQEGLQQL